MPKTWFVESLLVTILCCLPFGLAAFLKASKVESLYYAGYYEVAEEASKDAKKWTIIGLCSAVAAILIYIIYAVFVGAVIGLNDF